jgi:hypothetical protein
MMACDGVFLPVYSGPVFSISVSRERKCPEPRWNQSTGEGFLCEGEIKFGRDSNAEKGLCKGEIPTRRRGYAWERFTVKVRDRLC